MTGATHTGDGGADSSHRPDASAELVVTIAVPETQEAFGASSPAAPGTEPKRLVYPVSHHWESAESCREHISEQCRGVWERWVADVMTRLPYLNWTCGGYGPGSINCTEQRKPSGERFWECFVRLRCWAQYEGRLDSQNGPGSMFEVAPALTPEEWLNYAPLDRTLAQHAPAVALENTHAAAALALHGQRYGFTWDDYWALLDRAHDLERDYDGDFMTPEDKQQVDALRSIAARIAALLPPRDSEE
jgi:hypothetical protein